MGGHGELQDHVIPPIWKIRAPEEEDALPMCQLAEMVEKVVDVALLVETFMDEPGEDILVLEEQRHRKGDLKPALVEKREQLEGSSPA